MPVNIKNQKEEKRAMLTKSLGLPKNTRAILLSFVENEDIKLFLREACEALSIKLITGIDDTAIEWADAFVTDTFHDNLPLRALLSSHVVPIIPATSRYEKIFREFNPMKFEGNAFIFDEANKYLIFEKIVRYLENIRYPWDKRTLLQNIEKTSL